MQLVEVVWDDAWSDVDEFTTLHGVHQTHRPMVIQTLGWLLQDDETGVSLANERSMDDGAEVFRGRTFIPRKMIKSVTPFNLVHPRVKKARPPSIESET